MADDPKPLLFISHKHVNKSIADVLRTFIDVYTSGNVDVFQSSSAEAAGPQAGFNLNQELKKALWRCGAFIMIYTQAAQDWSYCMYEYGVANRPQSADTRMILFQCGDSVPALFAGQVNVNVRELSSVQKFVNQLLTNPDFFPDYGGPVTRHLPNSGPVATAAADLFQKLQPVLPPLVQPSVEEWPAYPYLQLQLDMQHVEAIKAAPQPERLRTACELIQKEAIVSAVDKECARLFNAPDLEGGVKFESLVKVWQENDDKTDSKSKWVESLCRQVTNGALWKFPPIVWELMKEIGGDTWYAPILARVSRVPNQHMHFDIYFFKFQIDNEKNCVKVGIPEE